jgi:beta-fructofuranosidase
LLPSDQRPRFHFQPTLDATNDVQGPFYDPRHKLYHMGFAWHVNGTHGISSAPNRWWHQISRDLAHWQIVSTTPERAMLKPDMPYDDVAVMTGSVTVVDGTPHALYSCKGSENKGKGWSRATVALASAANLSDPMLLRWDKAASNPVLNPGFKPAGMPVSSGFRDPSSAWLSGGKWRVLTACENCNGSTSMLGLFSAAQTVDAAASGLEGPWEFTSTPLELGQLECPDYWPIVQIDQSGSSGGAAAEAAAAGRLSAIKLSHANKETVWVGTMDGATQTMVSTVAPLVPNGNAGNDTQLLDSGTYASKSFYDPVHKQQVWTSWVRDSGGYCALNASVCSTHTLPRTLLYDPSIRAHVTPPVPQTELLRRAKLHSLPEPVPLGANAFVPLPEEVAASGMQLEIIATFSLPFPAGLQAGVSVRRSEDGRQGTASCIGMGPPSAPPSSCVRRPGALGQELGRNGNGTLAYGHGENSAAVAAAAAAGVPVASVSTVVSNTNDLPLTKGKHNGTEHHGGQLSFALKPSDTNVTLRIFVDHSVIESYAQGGRAVVTQRSYPTDDAVGVAVGTMTAGDAAVGVTLLALDVYQVGTIWVEEV